jgi:hypothetical protein
MGDANARLAKYDADRTVLLVEADKRPPRIIKYR